MVGNLMMQKYLNKKNPTDIRYFEKNVDVSQWLDLSKFRAMTTEEILKHETVRPTEFHTVWDQKNKEWLDSRTPEEIKTYNRSIIEALTKKQFNLYIYDNNLLFKLELLFEANPRIKIEFDSVTTIDRISSIVDFMKTEFSWTEEKVDELWTEALAIN